MEKITEEYNLLLPQNSWNWAIYKELKHIWLTVVGIRDPQKHKASLFQSFYNNHPVAYSMVEDITGEHKASAYIGLCSSPF